MAPRMGRPPKPEEEVRSAGVHIRVTPSEKKEIMDYIDFNNKLISNFL